MSALAASVDSELSSYLAKIYKIPMLTLEEEQGLAKSWAVMGDLRAAQKIIASHLRLVVKIALKFRHYGLPIMDLISEGNIGLMKAVKNFDLSLGYRVSTYAMWWIKAAVQEYVYRSWSLVKVGTSSARRRLFFGLKRMKNKLLGDSGRKFLDSDEIEEIAEGFKVSSKEVADMDSLLSQEPMALEDRVGGAAAGDDGAPELKDVLASSGPNQEVMAMEAQESERVREAIKGSLRQLDERTRDIFVRRRLASKPATLAELGECYGVSKERVRQIEKRAAEKMRSSLAMVWSEFKGSPVPCIDVA